MENERKIVYFDMETIGKHEEPWNGKIITIQIRRHGKTTIWKEWELGEEGVINAFFDFLNSIKRKAHVFVGFGIRNKDIPFLVERMRVLDLWSRKRHKILNFWLNWVDFYQLLGGDYVKFREICNKFQIKAWKGKHPSRLYPAKKFRDIEKYIEREMVTMEKLHEELKKSKVYREIIALRGKVSYDLEQAKIRELP